MSDLDVIRDLFQHMEWADARVWTSVLSVGAADADEIIRERLFHIHVVQHAFQYVWREQPFPAFPDKSKFADLAALGSWGHDGHEGLRTHLDGLDGVALERPITLPFADRFVKQFGPQGGPITLGTTMLQVASHTTHHRGQVNARIRELGGEPPFVDYIAWVWFGKAAADWSGIQSDVPAAKTVAERD